MTNPKSDFLKYRNTPFQRDILPIIPAGATLRADSKLTPDHLGKIPGRFHPATREWTGLYKWESSDAKERDLERWQLWQEPNLADSPISIGMHTYVYIAVDIDVDKEELVQRVMCVLECMLGTPGAIRRRHGSVRRVAFFMHKANTAPITKSRFAFKVTATDEHFVVEVLGQGQQVVIEGPHAKGAMHYWQDDIGLIQGLERLQANPKTVDDISSFMSALKDMVDDDPELEPLRLKLPTGGSDTPGVAITDIMSPHLAEDQQLLTRAMWAINLDNPIMDYDKFIDTLRALKAATGDAEGFFEGQVWPWACTQTVTHGSGPRTEDRGIEWLQERWNSFHDSTFGARYIYELAASPFGFKEGMAEIRKRDAQDVFGNRPLPVLDDGDNGSQGLPGSQSQAMGGGSGGLSIPLGPSRPGPLPTNYTDKALANLAATRIADTRKHSSDEGWVRLENGIWVRDKTVLYPISELCAEVGAPYRAQGPVGQDIDNRLNSSGKHQSVEVAMRNHPSFAVDAHEFDADPWMLNTPAGVWDMRTAVMHPHGALMRMQTLVAPDLAGLASYERACPKWMAYLDFVADGRNDVIPFLQRWGAMNFIGKVLGSHFLFIHGLSGTGKTVFIDVCLRIGKSYGMPMSNRFFMRTDEKRTFELYQLFNKRMAVADETPKGSTWDEMMLLTMHNGSELSAEGKGKDFLKFRNTATVTITGNHKPNFVTHAEESGIDRRLLVLTMNKKIADHMSDNEHFSEEIVAEEGPAILMWFMQGAYEGYQHLQWTGSFMGDLVTPFKMKAKEYRRQSNPFLQWIEEKMEISPVKDVAAHEAYHSFVNFVKDENPRFHISKQDFRTGLMHATGEKVVYKRLTGQERKGRWVFEGLSYREDGDGDDPERKVVPFRRW